MKTSFLGHLLSATGFAAVVVFVQLLAVGSARAEDAELQADYHMKRGRMFLEEGRYREAITEFDRAYTLSPSHEYLPDIARTHEAMGNFDRAIEAYEAYIRKGGKKLKADERKRAKAEIKRLGKAKKAAENSETARRHFEAGNAYQRQGSFGLAIIEFEQAYKVTGDPVYLKHMGKAHEDNGDKGKAAESYRRFLREGEERIPGAERVAVEQEIARLEGAPPPAGPKPSGPEPENGTTGDWERYFYIGFGYERLGDPAAAIAAFERYLADGAGSIGPAREAEVREALDRLRGGGTSSQTSYDATSSTQPAGKEEPHDDGGRVWTWVSIGIGGAAGVGAAVTGALALSKEKDVRSQCDGNACPPSTYDDIDAVQTLGPVTDVLIGVAAAGIVTGVILYFVEGREEPTTSVAVTPLSSGGAVTIGGSF